MKRRLPPLHALRAFEAAARLGRMSAAADELCVTPGAISRQVRQLELSLQLTLFEGSKNKPQLTRAAKALLPALSAAFDSMEAAVQAVTATRRSTLDVSCFSTFTVKWLIPRLFGFHAQHPDIEIRLGTADQTAATDPDHYDVVITVAQDAETNTSSIPLFPEWLGPVLAPALAAHISLHSTDPFAAQSLLQTQTRLNAWPMWAAAQGCALPAQTGPVFEHYYFTLEAAIAGLGISIAPWHLVGDDIRAGRLVAPFGFQQSSYRYIAQRTAKDNANLDVFCAWLQTQAAAMPTPSQTPSVPQTLAPNRAVATQKRAARDGDPQSF